MKKLGELYSNFSRIDLDTRGGYARVAKVMVHNQENFPEYCAFKLLRHELDYQKAIARFEDELRVLFDITSDPSAPPTITRIFDSGFVPMEVSQYLHERETPSPEVQIISTHLDIQKFLEMKSTLWEGEPGHWLPYLVVELAPYDDSLLRQVHQQHFNDSLGLYRLPTGEIIAAAVQLLDVMSYLHSTQRRAYIDWKPEHIFWNGLRKQVKLIDWNVTVSLDAGLGERQNIRDDIRLFCGAVLYVGTTFIDPDNPSRPIGPRPTTELNSPIPEIRRRYWTDKPDFYQRGEMLDERLKQIISQGLNPNQGFDSVEELKSVLLEYAHQELGLLPDDDLLSLTPKSAYFRALAEMRLAQEKLLEAQQHLIDATELHGEALEFTRLSKVINRTLMNFPIS